MTAFHEDYYRILQVHPQADPEVIQAAYRRLARRYHPDTGGSNTSQMAGLNTSQMGGSNTSQMAGSNMSQMQQLNQAYETLSDPLRRDEYDRWYRSHYLDRLAQPAEPTPEPAPALWRLLVPTALSLCVLAVLILDILRLGIRGFPEITLLLVAVGWVVYHFANLKDRSRNRSRNRWK